MDNLELKRRKIVLKKTPIKVEATDSCSDQQMPPLEKSLEIPPPIRVAECDDAKKKPLESRLIPTSTRRYSEKTPRKENGHREEKQEKMAKSKDDKLPETESKHRSLSDMRTSRDKNKSEKGSPFGSCLIFSSNDLLNPNVYRNTL